MSEVQGATTNASGCRVSNGHFPAAAGPDAAGIGFGHMLEPVPGGRNETGLRMSSETAKVVRLGGWADLSVI